MVTVVNKVEYLLNGQIRAEQYTTKTEDFEQYSSKMEKHAKTFVKLRKGWHIETSDKGNEFSIKYFDNNTLKLTRSITLI